MQTRNSRSETVKVEPCEVCGKSKSKYKFSIKDMKLMQNISICIDCDKKLTLASFPRKIKRISFQGEEITARPWKL